MSQNDTYTICGATDMHLLVLEVEKGMADGFKCQGGVSYHEGFFLQAMVRSDPIKTGAVDFPEWTGSAVEPENEFPVFAWMVIFTIIGMIVGGGLASMVLK